MNLIFLYDESGNYMEAKIMPVGFCKRLDSKTMIRLVHLSALIFFGMAHGEDAKPITFEMAFKSGEPKLTLSNGSPDGWFDESHFFWVEREGDEVQYYKVNAETGNREKLPKPERARNRSMEHRSEDGKNEVWVEDGDLYLAALETGKTRRLTASKDPEQNPRFSPDGARIAYTRAHNLFMMDLATGLERQLTRDGSETVYNGYASWVYFEEILGRASRYRAFWWSPDSEKLMFLWFDDGPVRTFPIYHTDGPYGHIETTRYPKAGERNPMVKAGVVNADDGKLVWLDFDGQADDYIAWPFWTPDSGSVHLQWMNRDQNHLIIYACNAANGEKRVVYEEQQDAWVEFFDDITYLADGSGFILRSDKDGWRHLYLHAMDGALVRRLTSGPWTVTGIDGVDLDRKLVYFSGNKGDSGGSGLFSVSLDGSGFRAITKPGGSHRTSLSPGYNYFLDSFSDYKTPTRTSLHRIDGARVRELADSHNPEADAYRKARVEYFTIPSTDGVEMPAWWVVPDDLDHENDARRHAVIFRIYSGPGASTVRNSFSRTWRDHYYALNGVITISVDHRGSGHFGKQGVASMYRKLGHWELHDLIKAVEWLRAKPFIDPNRIGITGGSYGGYMTLLALTKGGDYFTHGVAGSPVTDWAFYDSVYTERYMDRPQDNSDGYKDGSVLTYADRLKGKLRLYHGDIDDNVHLQNSTQLVELFTKHNIQFEYMIYPGSRHGVRQRMHRMDGENAFWFRHFLDKTFGD